jgi:two-component system, chemotaxis family, response regulator Rcp1
VNKDHAIEILLVEDNPGDVRLTRELFRESRVRNHLSVATDGADALAFLRQEEPHLHSRRPDLIVLDLNLPRLDGRQVLAAIKNDHGLRRIPVVVFSSSQAQEDIRQSYELHANCYLTKPLNLDEYTMAVRSIEDFWFRVVQLPSC